MKTLLSRLSAIICTLMLAFTLMAAPAQAYSQRILQPPSIFDGSNASQFRQEINDTVEINTDVVVVDFHDVQYMDESGLGALVLGLKTVRAAGARMYLCNLNDQVMDLLELTSMNRVFEITETCELFENN